MKKNFLYLSMTILLLNGCTKEKQNPDVNIPQEIINSFMPYNENSKKIFVKDGKDTITFNCIRFSNTKGWDTRPNSEEYLHNIEVNMRANRLEYFSIYLTSSDKYKDQFMFFPVAFSGGSGNYIKTLNGLPIVDNPRANVKVYNTTYQDVIVHTFLSDTLYFKPNVGFVKFIRYEYDTAMKPTNRFVYELMQ